MKFIIIIIIINHMMSISESWSTTSADCIPVENVQHCAGEVVSVINGWKTLFCA
jgi:hypothetical protein